MPPEDSSTMDFLAEKLTAEQRERAAGDLRLLLDAGIDSRDALLRLVADPGQDLELRRVGCWFLGLSPAEPALEVLLRVFRETDDEILLWESAKAIAALGDTEALWDLLEIASGDPRAERRAAAIHTVGRLDEPTAVGALLAILGKKAEAPKVRGHAAEALGQLADTRAIPLLIAALEDDSAEVRFWSVFALGLLRAKEALPELEQLAAEDGGVLADRWTIREEAADAIRSIRGSAG